jgi:DNA primase
MGYRKLSFVDACKWLIQEYGIATSANVVRPIFRPKRILPYRSVIELPSVEKRKEIPLDIANKIVEYTKHSLWTSSLSRNPASNFLFRERKLDREVIHKLSIGYIPSFPDFLMQRLVTDFSRERLEDIGLVKTCGDRVYPKVATPCLTFPYYDEKGELLGIQTRYLGTDKSMARFLFILQKRQSLFNLSIIKDLPLGSKLYISEGVTDCLSLLSSGLNAVALPSANILPMEDFMKLRKFHLYMYPDNDIKGEDAYNQVRRSALRMGQKLHRCSIPLEFKDYSCFYCSNKHDDEE